MRITDELREWWVRKFPVMDKELHKDFTAIANRIDAEHESKVGCTADEWDYWESTHIELPKDAHDECIYVGDMLDGYGKTIEVVELRIGRSGWVIVSRDGNAYADTFAFAHHNPPTVEDVLQELVVDWDCAPDGEDKAAVLKEYAAKLQLKESE